MVIRRRRPHDRPRPLRLHPRRAPRRALPPDARHRRPQRHQEWVITVETLKGAQESVHAFGKWHREQIMTFMQKHFVTFYSPGTFVAETTTKPIDKWDVDTAVQMAQGGSRTNGAPPYGV